MTEKANTDLPKSALNRLRAQQGGGSVAGQHPDANLLAAFSEQALEAGEREQVLAHLGQCPDCREIVTLSLPEVETLSLAERRGWFGLRPEFIRWGIVGASAAVVVAAVLLVKPELESPREVQDQVTTAKPADRTGQAVSEPSVVAEESPKGTARVAKRAAEKEAKTADEKRNERALARPSSVAALPPPPSALGVSGGSSAGVLGGVMSPKGEQDAGRAAGAAVANESKDVTSTLAVVARSQPEANAPVVAKEEGQTSPMALRKQKMDERPKMARADSATMKAADANTVELETASAKKGIARNLQSSAMNVKKTWRIAGEKLQWSQDGGANWLSAALPGGVKAMSVDAGGAGVVWVGAAAGVLLKSSDEGATWTPVKGLWAGDVVHIKFQDAKRGILRTSRPGVSEEWGTEDGGVTWIKRYSVGG